jgi:hypothetical protein
MSDSVLIGNSKIAYLPKFTLAQFETISAAMELEGWASANQIHLHGGHFVSLPALVEKGVFDYREYESARSAFPVREWRISRDYLKPQEVSGG